MKKNETIDVLENPALHVAKREVSRKRQEIKEVKEDFEKFDNPPIPIMPQDYEIMYASLLVSRFMKMSLGNADIKDKYLKTYNNIDAQTSAKMTELQSDFEKDFERAKAKLTKIVESHPLWAPFKDIRGFTPYQLGLIMGAIKNPTRFDTPSKLMVFAGLASINNMPVTKANLENIKQVYADQGRVFKGFKTALSGRMYNVSECLIRGRGYFHMMYTRIRERLSARCINGEECFVATADDVKASKGVMELNRLYMKGKKNQSLEMFTHKNAMRRISRTLLHLIYTEWMRINGLQARNPYAIDYMSHTGYISLDEVTAYDRAQKDMLKAQAAEKRTEGTTKTGGRPKKETSTADDQPKKKRGRPRKEA